MSLLVAFLCAFRRHLTQVIIRPFYGRPNMAIWPHFGHIGTAIKWPNEYLYGMSTEKCTEMLQPGEGIKKIKQLPKKLWPKQMMANFPLYFLTFPL